MFGPGTACRCATCTQLPDTCQWGRGPYAGTTLMYAQVMLTMLLMLLLMFLLQEMAINHMWSQREYEAAKAVPKKAALLDANTHGEDNVTICQSALLHARHGSEIFSKVSDRQKGLSNSVHG